MKKKKLLLAALTPTMVFGIAACSNKQIDDSASKAAIIDNSASIEEAPRLSAEPEDEMITEIVESLISKGADLITGGIKTYAKTVVLNLLKECGFDFRDATTKTLEKIQNQLNAIEVKMDVMAKRQDQIHSEDVLGGILKTVNETNNNYGCFVSSGLGYLAELENDPNMKEETIEAARLSYYHNSVENLLISGLPVATFVSNLADYILLPNGADPAKNIFDYYENTLGVYDTWSILKIKNMRNFMAYIDSVLVSAANLAKFQTYYKTLGMDAATIKTQEAIINAMATKVNNVNALFKAQLDALKVLEEKRDAGINIYMATNKEYSTRMATLTFDVNEKDGDDSRQGLLMDYYCYSDGRRGNAYKFAMEYVPDQDFNGKLANDFKTYAGSFCTSDYTIKDYLKYAGFYAKNEELFDKSIGIYNANMYADGMGFLNDDYEYTATYFNEKGVYSRKAIWKVDSYHNWNCVVTRTEFSQRDDSYYLCFATPDGDQQKLDGTYQSVFMADVMSTVVDKVFFRKYDVDIRNTNKTGWVLHDCW